MGYLKQSLRLARRLRTCPPPAITAAPEHRAEVERHVSLCPHCSKDMHELLALFDRLSESLETVFGRKPDPSADGPPEPGDLRIVCSSLAGWRDGFYYSPPMILVLDRIAPPVDALKTAQTCPDIALAGPGDLILNGGQTGVGSLFVETWHVYALKASHLGPRLGRVSREILAAALEMAADPEKAPDRAPLTAPLGPEDPRIHFRKLEAEVGCRFASRSAASSPLFSLSPAVLTALFPSVRLRKNATDPFELIATAGYPDAHYAGAAADDAREWVRANRIRLKEGRILSFDPVRVDIMIRTPIPGGVSVVGQIAGIPEDPGPHRIHCFLETETGGIVASNAPEWDPVNRRFFAVFKTGAPPDGRLFIAIITGE